MLFLSPPCVTLIEKCFENNHNQVQQKSTVGKLDLLSYFKNIKNKYIGTFVLQKQHHHCLQTMSSGHVAQYHKPEKIPLRISTA